MQALNLRWILEGSSHIEPTADVSHVEQSEARCCMILGLGRCMGDLTAEERAKSDYSSELLKKLTAFRSGRVPLEGHTQRSHLLHIIVPQVFLRTHIGIKWTSMK